MPDADAVRRAAILIRSKHGNWKAAARLLAKRVKALGIPNPLKKKPAAGEDRHPGRRQVRLRWRDDGRQALHHVQGREADGQADARGHRARRGEGEGQAAGPVPRLRRQAEPQARVPAPNAAGSSPRCRPMVAKNHDFMCLGCGHDLDKGEKLCPGCGKENPGHNPMADHENPGERRALRRRKPERTVWPRARRRARRPARASPSEVPRPSRSARTRTRRRRGRRRGGGKARTERRQGQEDRQAEDQHQGDEARQGQEAEGRPQAHPGRGGRRPGPARHARTAAPRAGRRRGGGVRARRPPRGRRQREADRRWRPAP